MMQKIMVSMTKEMLDALKKEQRSRKLGSVPETVRSVVGEYLKTTAEQRA
jgi:hypothetical protein